MDSLKSLWCKKSVFVPIIFCLLFTLLFGCAKDLTTTDTTTEATPGAAPSAKIVVADSQMVFNPSGDLVLVVDFEFTNNFVEAASFSYLCKDTAYQNGIECENDTEAAGTTPNLLSVQVQPGATKKISIGYKLKDKSSAVEIEIKDWLSGEFLLRQIITL